MTAQEYFGKYGYALIQAWEDKRELKDWTTMINGLFVDMLTEADGMIKAIDNPTTKEWKGIVKEQNQKWNELRKLIKERCGFSILGRNGFSNMCFIGSKNH